MIKVSVDLKGVLKKVDKICNNRKVGMFLNATCARYWNEFVPERKGALKKSVRLNIPFKVVYDRDYAEKVYKGENITIHKDKNPNATKEWDKVAMQSHENQIAKETTDYIKRL